MVDKTHYTDGSELTYQEKNHLVGFCTDLENYNIYNQTPQHYGQYVPLVHVLNYGNYHGDTLVRFFTITTSVHLLHTSKTSTSLLTMKLLLCFSTENPRGLCASFDVSEWQPSFLNIYPGHPTNLNCPYRVSKRSGDITIKEWKKCMDSCMELLGSNIQRRANIGDRMIAILHNGESGSILFYAILP